MMKKYLFILFTIISSASIAQPEFKEVYKSLGINDRFSNMMNLRDYQYQNHDHAIAYFLLAEIYDQYMRETDPLVLLDVLTADYQELKTNYGLAKFKLDESQVRRDREYFGEIKITTTKRNVSLPDIVNEIDNRLKAAEVYSNDAINLHNSYYRCIEKYNQCLFKYREILKFNPNYKDMYLMVDDDLIADVQGIAVNFDSVMIYFDSYKISCSKMPHLIKVNQYHLNPIITYRLEGLVDADFTLPVVELWDFKSWAESFLKNVDNDIVPIRKGMVDVDNRLDQQIGKLKNEDIYGDNLSVFKPEDKFLNLIGKYDYSSIVKDLFEYKKSKVEFLAMTRRAINNPKDSISEFMINRLRYYKDLAFQKKALNERADRLKKSVSIDALGKYNNFFDLRYRGIDGFIRWCDVDKYDNDRILALNLEHIPIFIDQEKTRKFYPDTTIAFGKYKFSFGAQNPSFDSLWSDTLFTTCHKIFKKGSDFIWGVKYNKKHSMNSFLAKTDKTGKVEWFSEPRFQVKDSVLFVAPVFNQIFADSTSLTLHHVISRNGADSSGFNFLVKCDWNGKITKTIQLGHGGYPRYFYIDEINENYLLVTKGDRPINNSQGIDTITFLLTDYSGVAVWDKKFLLNGDFVDIVHTNSNFFVFCNTTFFSSSDKNFVMVEEPQSDQTSVLGLYFNRDGTIRYGYTYSMAGGLYINFSQKITSNLINMQGRCKEGNRNDEIFYLLTDSEGEPVISTSEKFDYQKLVF